MAGERSKTILLVEDNPQDLDLGLGALKANGIDNPVKVCRDGADAIDYVQEAERHGGGASSYVPKAVNFDRFVEAIGQVGRYWLTINQLPRR